jgi:hypothetical protein
VQQHRRRQPVGQLGSGPDVVVMSMGAGDGDDSAGADRRGDGVGIVRSVDDQHLVVIPQEPRVVVDVEGALPAPAVLGADHAA